MIIFADPESLDSVHLYSKISLLKIQTIFIIQHKNFIFTLINFSILISKSYNQEKFHKSKQNKGEVYG